MKPGAPPTLGLLGVCPRGVEGPAAFDTFARLQQHLGELEAAAPGSYPVAHAACAAFMNGVPRAAFAGVVAPAEPASWAVAAVRLIDAFEPALLAAPGLVDAAATRRLVQAFVERTDRIQGREPPVLWLDAPDRAGADAVLAHAQAVSADGERVRVAVPFVPTLSPGRRQYERLPATCLVAPLALGAAHELKGVSEPEAPFDLDQLARLEQAGVGVLAPVGPRRLVGAAFALERPRVPPLGPEPGLPPDFEATAAALEAELDDLATRLQHQGLQGPSLQKALARDAGALLAGYRARGVIAGYAVRCDESTGTTAGGAPVLEIGLAVPRRVQQVVLRVGAPRSPSREVP